MRPIFAQYKYNKITLTKNYLKLSFFRPNICSTAKSLQDQIDDPTCSPDCSHQGVSDCFKVLYPEKARKDDISIVAIGVGDQPNFKQLQNTASATDDCKIGESWVVSERINGHENLCGIHEKDKGRYKFQQVYNNPANIKKTVTMTC